jgi:hypothetical protein
MHFRVKDVDWAAQLFESHVVGQSEKHSPQRLKPRLIFKHLRRFSEEAAGKRGLPGTATTGAEAHADSAYFTRPWKGRSSTATHTFAVFRQPLKPRPFKASEAAPLQSIFKLPPTRFTRYFPV